MAQRLVLGVALARTLGNIKSLICFCVYVCVFACLVSVAFARAEGENRDWVVPPKPPKTPHHGHKQEWPGDDYVLTQNYLPHNLTEGFEFKTAADYPGTGDPTNGFVNYVDHQTAHRRGLVKRVRGIPGLGAPLSPYSRGHEQLYLGVDFTTVLNTTSTDNSSSSRSSSNRSTDTPSQGPPRQGRDSIRLESKRVFNRGLLIADFAHMPGNQCGVWPAFWTYNMEEDPIGEIDVIEGFNFQPSNVVSLHTGQTCRFDAGWQTGTDQRAECALFVGNTTNDDGCGMTAAGPASYGTAFNRAGGGVYATLLDDHAVRIWHWPRRAVPADIRRGKPMPWTWGQPLGDMSQTHGSCDVAENFHTLTIIINTDFCGDIVTDSEWTADAECAKYASCNEFVAAHPEAFREAYWLVNSIKVYEPAQKRPHWPPHPPHQPHRPHRPHRPYWPYRPPPRRPPHRTGPFHEPHAGIA